MPAACIAEVAVMNVEVGKESTPLLLNNSTINRSPQRTRISNAKSFIRSVYHPRSLIRRKPISVCLEERNERGLKDGSGLAESLGLSDVLGYGIGCTVGAGIYSQIAVGVGVAGPAVSVSFAIGAIACVFTALAYCEFSARVPVTGSAYTFAYASFGELLGWMIGWDLTLEYCISAAAIARSWGSYFVSFWELWGFDPKKLIWLNALQPDGTHLELSPAAAAIVILCTVVMLFGIRSSSTFNVVITILNFFVLLFFIFVGATRVQPRLWTEDNGYFPKGASSVFVAAGKLFFAYLGFDMVSSLAEETKNPQRNIPLGIIGSLIVAASMYIAISLVATGMVPYMDLKDPNGAPLAVAMVESGIPWAAKVITTGSLLGLTSTTFTCLLGQPRIFYTMARDGLFFPFFKWTTKNTEVPVIGTVLTGIFTAILAFFMSLDSLSNAISVGTLLAFNLVNSGVMIIRYSTPKKYPIFPTVLIGLFVVTSFVSAFCFDRNYHWAISAVFAALALLDFGVLCIYHVMHRTQNIPQTFKCPLVPLVPCLGIAVNTYMLAGLDKFAWVRLFVWLAIGLVIYFVYGIHRSKLRVSTKVKYVSSD